MRGVTKDKITQTWITLTKPDLVQQKMERQWRDKRKREVLPDKGKKDYFKNNALTGGE